MTQQRIDTTSVVDIRDEVILASQDHLAASPVVTYSFLPADVSPVVDEINIPSHGLNNGDAVYFYSTNMLPTGLSPYTTYYIINTTPNTFKVSDTYNGASVDINFAGAGTHTITTGLAVKQYDPWDDVLSALNNFALTPSTVVSAMDAAFAPSVGNPFVTNSHLDLLVGGNKNFVLIGPTGSDADFIGNNKTPFTDAITYLQGRDGTTEGGWIVVLPGTYTFTSTLSVPDGIRIEGLHPETTFLVSSGNFAVVDLAGSNACLDKFSLQSAAATTQPTLKITGQRCTATLCKMVSFGFSALQLTGMRNTVKACRIQSSAVLANPAVFLQGIQNKIEHCSFAGTLSGGAVKIEGDGGGVFANYFAATMTGFAYKVLSNSVNNTRLIANYYGSAASVALSLDAGSDTVRYANMPNAGGVNDNNFLVPLQRYTGQPTLNTDTVTTVTPAGALGTPFSFPVTDDDLTTITSDLDLFLERTFEERNWFLTSTDPTFDGVGAPLSGIFAWNGTTLTFPQFYVQSVFARNARWVINAGSANLSANQVLYVDIDQSLAGIDIVLVPQVGTKPLALNNPNLSQRLVLALGLGSNAALWTQGYRLLTALTSFDVEGTPLPLVRFVGLTESRNPAVPFDGFSATAQANLVDKLSAQSAHLKLQFERTNVSLEPLTANAEFSSEAIAGAWLVEPLASSLPATPTHILQVKGSAYALVPASGIYRYHRDGAAWSLVSGNPGTAPFTAMAPFLSGLALLQTNGGVVSYDPDAIGGTTWTSFGPSLSSKVTSVVPFASSRPSGFMPGGQADYAVQTPNHSIFTTLDGYTVRFSLQNNAVDIIPRVFTEGARDTGLLSFSQRDTGYNSLRDPVDGFELLDNGLTKTCALPVGFKGKFLPGKDSLFDEFKATKFDSLLVENFSHDSHSGSFLCIAKNTPLTKYYIIGGGKDVAYLYDVLTIASAPQFTNFTAHFWAALAAKQQVICTGTLTSTGAFAALIGSASGGTWTWINQTLGGATTSVGSIGVYDHYYGGTNVGDFYALASNPSRTQRPTLWKRDGITGSWTFKTFNSVVSLPEDVLVPAGVANSYMYIKATDAISGYGVASPAAISFLVADGSRSNRPTMFYFNRTATYGGVRLGDVAGPTVDVVSAAATSSSATKSWGGSYSYHAHTQFWFVTDTLTTNKYFMQHQDTGFLAWSSGTVATALTCSFIGRSGNLTACNNFIYNTYSGSAPYKFQVLADQGVVTLTANSLTVTSTSILSIGVTTDDHVGTLTCFSSGETSTYMPSLGSFRAGEPSISIGSFVEESKTFVQGAGFGNDPDLGGGIFWYEPGSYVKSLAKNIWAGLNRGGYLWIADSSKSTRQTEFSPNLATVRGDVLVTNLGSASSYDYAFDGTGTNIGFVYPDAANGNKLGFVIYDVATATLSAPERAGFAPLNPPGTSAVIGIPRIVYNPTTVSWDITVQDNSRTSGNGQLAFYRRPVASAAWVLETIGPATDPGATKVLASMTDGNGKNPSRAAIAANGDVVVATEASSSSNLLVAVRQQSNEQWLTVTATLNPITGGGFASPQIAISGTTYWIFGNRDSLSVAKVITTTNYLSWSAATSFATSTTYNRAQEVTVFPYSDGVAVAAKLANVSPLAGTLKEFGVFRFYNAFAVSTNIVSANGRLQSAFLSGDEEADYTQLSFGYSGALMMAARRPGRFTDHWSVRLSNNQWANYGDSALGSGRLLAIGNKTFRENYQGVDGVDLIHEFDSTETRIRTWTDLPVAERELGQYIALRYPFSADGSAARLFRYGNPTVGMTSDINLQNGQLPTVTARQWLTVVGSTRVQGGAGASVLQHGSMLFVAAPPSTTNTLYFGSATVGTAGLFRIDPQDTLTIKGSWKLSAPNNAGRSYTITGPLTFNLDASTLGHLVLNFPTASSLTLDAAANPLSYWQDLNHSQTNYAVVLGELRSVHFFLYGLPQENSHLSKLTLGSLEPREWTETLRKINYAAPVSQYAQGKILGQRLYVSPVTIDSVTIKIEGSLRGIQRLDFPSIAGARHLLVVQGLPPLSTGYYFYRVETPQTFSGLEGLTVDHVAGRYDNLVVFEAF